MIKVCKFGGTSMADGTNFLRVKEIIGQDAARRYIVVSAPGKRYSGDDKVTDLLFAAHKELTATGKLGAAFSRVCERFRSIVRESGAEFDVETALEEVGRAMLDARSEAFTGTPPE